MRALPASGKGSELMLSWWCSNATNKNTIGCQQFAMAGKIAASPDPKEKASLTMQLRELNKGSQNAATKEYMTMKLAYCNQVKPPNKALCADPAAIYKKRDDSMGEAAAWFCAVAKNANSPICQRRGVTEALAAAPTEHKAELAGKLKQIGMPVYYQIQGMYTDFCKVEAHKAKSVCIGVRRSMEMDEVKAAWCTKQSATMQYSAWCDQQKMMDELRKTSMEQPTATEKIKELSGKLAKLAPGAIAREITYARSSWCAAPERKTRDVCAKGFSNTMTAKIQTSNSLNKP